MKIKKSFLLIAIESAALMIAGLSFFSQRGYADVSIKENAGHEIRYTSGNVIYVEALTDQLELLCAARQAQQLAVRRR